MRALASFCTVFVGLLLAGAPVRAQCSFDGACTPIRSGDATAYRPGDELRMSASVFTQGRTVVLAESVDAFQPDSLLPQTSLQPVEDSFHAFQIPMGLADGEYWVGLRFNDCPACADDPCAQLTIDSTAPASPAPPRPQLRSAVEIDAWSDSRLCGADQVLFDGFRNQPQRVVLIDADLPDAAGALRPVVYARIPRPDLSVDEVVRFNPSSLTYGMSRGGFIVPLGDHDGVRAVDIEVRYVNDAGERGPPASIHTTLGAEPPFCIDNGCDVAPPVAQGLFGCGDGGVPVEPPPGGGERQPPRAALGLLFLPFWLARPFRRENRRARRGQGDCS